MFLVCVFVFSLSILANADVALTQDVEVPGKPFEYLQQQIDYLQQQIDDLEQGCIPAAYSAHGFVEDVTDAEGKFSVVMEKQLPPGHYVSNISLGAQYQAENHGWWHECWAFLECQIEVNGLPLSVGGIGGNVVGITTHSSTEVLELPLPPPGELITVTLSCRNGCELCLTGDYPLPAEPPPLKVGGSWTFVEVVHN